MDFSKLPAILTYYRNGRGEEEVYRREFEESP